MFKKKPQIKQLAPLRSSERRKIADQVLDDLGLLPALPQEADEERKASHTQARTALRERILPEHAMAAKFATTHGPDQKPINGSVYVGRSLKDDDLRVLWFKIFDRMYPSVYMLWRLPGMVPLVHTTSSVLPKLQSGADLMTPGLTVGPPFDKRARKGALVGVADMDRLSVPLVVGTAEIEICELQEVQGMKGHAVRTMHWAGDELWAWSPSGKPGVDTPDKLEPFDPMQQAVNGQADKSDDATQKMAEMGLGSGGNNDESAQASGNGDDEKAADVEGEEANEPEREMTMKEIDEAFRNAFLYGVCHYMKTNPSQQNHGLDFPLQQSWVLSHLVQPFLPAFSAQQASQLQIKKTSFKNIKKFIRSLDKELILKSKERDGNEVVVVDIDFDDAAIKSFTPYRLPKKETAAASSAGRGGKANEPGDTGGDSSIGQSLKITILFKPKEKLTPLFEQYESGTHELYTTRELGAVISAYVEREKLAKETNKHYILVNPFLAKTVFGSDSAVDQEVVARGSSQRETLVASVVAQCAPYYHIIRNDDKTASKPKAGSPPKILVSLETRSGNKTVTKTSGLEAFFIPPQPLADELRKTCAGSTSVERLQGSSPKAPVMEVMVQGPQKDAVLKALEKRGVDKKWVEVVDKTKGKKK